MLYLALLTLFSPAKSTAFNRLDFKWQDGPYNSKWSKSCSYPGQDLAQVYVDESDCPSACALYNSIKLDMDGGSNVCSTFTYSSTEKLCYLRTAFEDHDPLPIHDSSSSSCGFLAKLFGPDEQEKLLGYALDIMAEGIKSLPLGFSQSWTEDSYHNRIHLDCSFEGEKIMDINAEMDDCPLACHLYNQVKTLAYWHRNCTSFNSSYKKEEFYSCGLKSIKTIPKMGAKASACGFVPSLMGEQLTRNIVSAGRGTVSTTRTTAPIRDNGNYQLCTGQFVDYVHGILPRYYCSCGQYGTFYNYFTCNGQGK